MSQLAIAGGAPWSRVVFTTYALSLTFFETVVMDALIRARARDVLILSDVEGIRCSLGEKGVRGAGRDYRIEPVAVTGGVFHPKIGAFIAHDQAVLSIGSGNLTFGGWAGNLEIVEHLHSSFAASAFGDAAGMFEGLADDGRVRHAAAEACGALADDLRRSVRGKTDPGDIRVLHGLKTGIGPQLADWAAELGGATRLAVVSPYFDDGAGISELARLLGLADVHIHRHESLAAGSAPNWPRQSLAAVRPVNIDFVAGDPRALHAKSFEILCRKGRLLVSGSANASGRALASAGNVEAVVLRRQPNRTAGWGWTPADLPAPQTAAVDAVETDEPATGVLRAELQGATLKGWVITPKMSGEATVDQLTGLGAERLGSVQIDEDGEFRLEAPDLEVQAWNAGRLVLRVRNGGRVAEGYAASAAAGAVARRVGAMAPRLFSILGGSDTPDDIIALLDWIFKDPEHLPGLVGASGSGGVPSPQGPDRRIAVDSLIWTPRNPAADGPADQDARLVARLVEQLRRSLRGRKLAYAPPPLPEPDEEQKALDLRRSEDQRRRHETSLSQSDDLTTEFLDWALDATRVQDWGIFALELLTHMAQRLDWSPARVRPFIEKVAGALTAATVSPQDRGLVAGSLLALVGHGPAQRVRAHMVRIRLELDAPPPAACDAPLYTLSGGRNIEAAWLEVQAVQCVEEAVAEFVRGLKDPATADRQHLQNSPLRDQCPLEWPTLFGALSHDRTRQRVLFGGRQQTACPKCYSALPITEVENYRTRFVATALNCDHGVIIFDGQPA